MSMIALTSGAYEAESLIANAQRCINLFPEVNPKETEPTFPTTHYVRPGLRPLGAPPAQGFGRCLYAATNGDLYAVVNQSVYYIDPDFNFHPLGNLVTDVTTPAYMADNGSDIIVVDGSLNGYDIAMKTRIMTQIGDPGFQGSTRVDFLDSFIIFNIPGTNQWYCTLSDQIAFNALYIGIKTAWPDNILCVVANERLAVLFGPRKGEPWYNAGSAAFPFNILPGIIIEQGCAAVYSPQKMDTNIYWLSQSPEGARMVMRINNQNVAERISTHAIEDEFLTYGRVDDAIGSVYQQGGHSFYCLHFPTADRTWVYDQATQQWWEDNWIDPNGALHRARNTFMAYAYGKNLGLDWATGQLYQVDPATLTDNGVPIPWIRSFPHFANELKYVSHTCFVADVATGTSVDTGEGVQFKSPWSKGFSSGFGPLSEVAAPTVSLRISRNGGARFGANRQKANISSGKYRSMMRWRGNGLARDAVFELSSTAEMCGALNGAYIDPVGASS